KDHKALQSGNSHYFGDKFSRAYDVTFAGRDNTLQYPFQTSWGSSTRLIGAIIMTHSDDSGLVLPPAVAPIQVIVLPIAQHKPGVLDKANEIKERLSKFCRAKLDDSDNSPGWKFAEYEMKGVPLRLEIGPRDIENNSCVIARRDNGEKTVVSLDELETAIPQLLQAVHDGLYQKALENRENRTYACKSIEEICQVLDEKGDGFVKAMWCGDEACEDKVKELTGVGSRCIPLEQEEIDDKCVCCGKPAKCLVYWGKAY
ncbi:MAG: proline--tRNA ligase, partial [Clostridia bacterium]|nr:proline--tRNA ligase [Clostridia bacterium]